MRWIQEKILQIKTTQSEYKLQAAIRFRNSMSLICRTESIKCAKTYSFWSWIFWFHIRLMKVLIIFDYNFDYIHLCWEIFITYIKMALQFSKVRNMIYPSANERREVLIMTDLVYILQSNVRWDIARPKICQHSVAQLRVAQVHRTCQIAGSRWDLVLRPLSNIGIIWIRTYFACQSVVSIR